MMSLIMAAAVAAQPAPAANAQDHAMPMSSAQHEAMKKDCCKECCKDMEAKMEGHHAERGE